MARVLIIDDDVGMGKMLSMLVRELNHEASHVLTFKNGVEALMSEAYDVVFLDVRLPDGNGLDMLDQIHQKPDPPEVIIITGAGDPDGAEIAIKNGAWDYLQKPISPQTAALPLKRVLEYRDNLKSARKQPVVLKRGNIAGSSDELNACLEQVGQAAGSVANVLITGETGTGKELFARAIHNNSSRSQGDLIVVDCAALPESLVESTLFGHEKGAFTGAQTAKEGLVKLADGGTLFLDEVGELDLKLQKAFLRVLQERRFRPVGGKHEVASDFRLIAATNKDLDQMVATGQFREDLLYRLRAIKIHLPPLRDRRPDINEIALQYLNRCYEKYGIAPKGLSPDVMDALQAYPWPGNVRELICALDSAVSLAQNEPMLFPKHLPTDIRVQVVRSSVAAKEALVEVPEFATTAVASFKAKGFPTYKEFRLTILERVEKRYFQNLMDVADGDIKQACQIAGLGRTRLYELLAKHEISRTE